MRYGLGDATFRVWLKQGLLYQRVKKEWALRQCQVGTELGMGSPFDSDHVCLEGDKGQWRGWGGYGEDRYLDSGRW